MKAYQKDEEKIKHHMRTIKNNYRNDIKMLKAGSTTIESIRKNIEDAANKDDDDPEDESYDENENREGLKRSFE